MPHMPKSLTRQISRHLRSLTGIVIALVINIPLHADEPLAGREFQHRMQATIGLTWASNPLRRALNSLSSSQQIAILLDRRVDPTQLINLQIQNQNLETTTKLIAERQSLGICYVNSVVYYGPKTTTSKLPTLAAKRTSETSKFTAASRVHLLGKSSFAWDDLATPRDLILDCAKAMQTSIKNPERIPHDLWPNNELPTISRIEFLTLALAGFDLTWRWETNGQEIELVSIPESVLLQRMFSKNISLKILNDLQKRFPNAEITQKGADLTVVGNAEDIDAIGILLAGGKINTTQFKPAPNRPAAKGKTFYSLAIEKRPVGKVLQMLTGSLGLELVYADDVTLDDKKQLVSFQVKDATAKQLLDATVAPAGLKCTLEDGQLRVTK
ncbi:MAG: hypothetical protein ACI9G1_000758 [Pirellulaceae bacterium]|jgi:hypothetical protein